MVWLGTRVGALCCDSAGLGTSGWLPKAVVLQSFLATDPVSLAIAGFLGCDLDNVFSLLNNHSGKRDSNFERAGFNCSISFHKQHPLPTLTVALSKCFQNNRQPSVTP